MPNEKIGLFIKNNPELLKQVKDFLETKKHKDVQVFDNLDSAKALIELGQALKSGQVSRGLAFDEYGNLPFMILGKFKSVVCAQISDEYSAHMTMEHNNATCLALGYELLVDDHLYHILDLYLDEAFAAGRHMVRVNMMLDLQKEEQ